METINQTVNTRNQGYANFQTKYFFIFDNHYYNAVFKNNSGSALALQTGIPVVRNTAIAGQVLPMTSSNIADFIGFVKSEGSVSLANNGTANIMVCDKGGIDPDYIILPAGVTLDTIPSSGTKAFRDFISAVGFRIDNATEITANDNQ